MRKSRDKFACVNETKHKGNSVVITVAVLAICITGILCAKKLQMDQKYITMELDNQQIELVQNS